MFRVQKANSVCVRVAGDVNI